MFLVGYGLFLIGTFHRFGTYFFPSISYRVWQNLLRVMWILIVWLFHLFIWLRDLHFTYFWRAINTPALIHLSAIYTLALWFSFNDLFGLSVDMGTFNSRADIHALDLYISFLSGHFNLNKLFWTSSNFS